MSFRFLVVLLALGATLVFGTGTGGNSGDGPLRSITGTDAAVARNNSAANLLCYDGFRSLSNTGWRCWKPDNQNATGFFI